MRCLAVLLALLALPAHAWEFRAGTVCELTHEMADGEVRVTYDARVPEYAIEVTRTVPWPAAPGFGIRFDGGLGLTITTDRHSYGPGGRQTLIVRDSGFGNVLNGLEFNTMATAFSGEAALRIPLTGAAEPVRRFRACAEAGIA